MDEKGTLPLCLTRIIFPDSARAAYSHPTAKLGPKVPQTVAPSGAAWRKQNYGKSGYSQVKGSRFFFRPYIIIIII